jgi:hypothetical protein
LASSAADYTEYLLSDVALLAGYPSQAALSATTTHEVDNLKSVPGLKLKLVPLRALGELAVQLDGDAVAFEVHGGYMFSDGGPGFQRDKFARLAVDGERERHDSSVSVDTPRATETGAIGDIPRRRVSLRNVVDCS